MPCRYDESDLEKEERLEQQLKSVYRNKLNKLTKLLCEACTILEEYTHIDNLRLKNKTLADWCVKHRNFDKERLAAAQEKKRLKQVTKNALAKLTKEEKEVLGLTI